MPRDIDSVADIVGACMTIAEYLQGVRKEEFLSDKMRVGATVRELEIIGEASKRLSAEFRDENSNVQWQHWAGMRDILIHAYDIVDLELVWNAAAVSAPILLETLKPLLPASFFEERRTDAGA
jgi:uncharacterized protein with HEPN domain